MQEASDNDCGPAWWGRGGEKVRLLRAHATHKGKLSFHAWDGKMIGKIIGRIWDRARADSSTRPIRVIQDSANSWRLVYAD